MYLCLIIKMKSSVKVHFELSFLFLFLLPVTHAQQSCPSPDVPRDGNYYPRKNSYLPEEKVNYECKDGYMKKGTNTNRCRTDGHWSHEMPFCDRKAEIKSITSRDSHGNLQPVPQVTDDSENSCFSLKANESIRMHLEKPKYLYAVVMHMKKGNINIEIANDFGVCSRYEKLIDESKWVYIQCHQSNQLYSYVRIMEKSLTNDSSTFCDVQIYTNGEGCENPPKIRIANGYFEVSRSLAKLICENGYEADRNNDRLVCIEDSWVGSRLRCNEISEESSGINTTNMLAFGAIGLVGMFILISLIAVILCYVRKQRRKVAEIQNQETEDSMVFGLEPDYVYPTVEYEPPSYIAMGKKS